MELVQIVERGRLHLRSADDPATTACKAKIPEGTPPEDPTTLRCMKCLRIEIESRPWKSAPSAP